MTEKKEMTPKKADVEDRKKVVKVKNISAKIINTSKGSIPPGEKGEATVAESITYRKVLERVK